jgi:hypothetical protein
MGALAVSCYPRALAYLLFTAVSVSPSGLASASGSSVGSVKLEAIQCLQGRSEAPQLSIAAASEYPNLHYVAADASIVQMQYGYYAVTDALPEGNYFFRLQSRHCFSYLQAAVLAGHTRALSIALNATKAGNGKMPFKLFDSENAVAGRLAIRPAVGWLVGPGGGKRVLDLQDDAYYIERVPPGRYALRFELHGSLQSEISLDVSDISPTQLVERDIDIATFRRNLGLISASGGTLKECGYCF